MREGFTTSLIHWQKSKEGQHIFSNEKKVISSALKSYQVDRVMQLCGLPYVNTLNSHIEHYLLMVEPWEPLPVDCSSLRADINHLWPIKDESFSGVIFSHSLERTTQGIDLLIQEARRVLEPDGVLMILGVSLTSMMAMKRLFHLDHHHWCASLYSDFHLHSKLIQSGFEIMPSFNIPTTTKKWFNHLPFLSMMDNYKITIARKVDMALLLNTSVN
tara:strand:+ start:365 stop:1012 length:648 start_codon:yes stop_codon:yes gene_type:complete